MDKFRGKEKLLNRYMQPFAGKIINGKAMGLTNKTQQKRLAKYETEKKDKCPFCNAPLLKEELGVKRCQNTSCTYKVERKLEQIKIKL